MLPYHLPGCVLVIFWRFPPGHTCGERKKADTKLVTCNTKLLEVDSPGEIGPLIITFPSMYIFPIIRYSKILLRNAFFLIFRKRYLSWITIKKTRVSTQVNLISIWAWSLSGNFSGSNYQWFLVLKNSNWLYFKSINFSTNCESFFDNYKIN